MSTKQPDLEIYLLNPDINKLESWLTDLFSDLTIKHQSSSSRLWQTATTDILFSEKVEKNFSSLWFKTNETDWDTDLALARAAFSVLETEVRCSAGGWQEEHGQDAEEGWIKINARGEKPFSW